MSHSIKHYTEDSIAIVELKSELIQAKVAVNIGCTMFSLKYNNYDVLYFKDTLASYAQHKKLAGIPFMHPWSNRLEADKIFNTPFPSSSKLNDFLHRDGNGLPLHGLILKSSKWKIDNMHSDGDSAVLSTSLLFDDEAMLSIFPFKHSVFLDIILHENSITYQTKIQCLESTEMPIAFGFHPYFNVLHSTKNYIRIPECKVAVVDNNMIPTQKYLPPNALFNFESGKLNIENKNIDHAFIHLHRNDNYGLHTENYSVEFCLDENYKVMQLYYPNHTEKPYICIEPMLEKANAFNEHSYTQTANKQFVANFKMKLF